MVLYFSITFYVWHITWDDNKGLNPAYNVRLHPFSYSKWSFLSERSELKTKQPISKRWKSVINKQTHIYAAYLKELKSIKSSLDFWVQTHGNYK